MFYLIGLGVVFFFCDVLVECAMLVASCNEEGTEISVNVNPLCPQNALFESQHEDENDVQTIAHKCEVLSYSQYKKRVSNASKKGRSLKPNVFFVAGFYDPAAKDVTFHPGVSWQLK